MLIKYPESINFFLSAFLIQTTNISHWELLFFLFPPLMFHPPAP